jgi:hypothetical protein
MKVGCLCSGRVSAPIGPMSAIPGGDYLLTASFAVSVQGVATRATLSVQTAARCLRGLALTLQPRSKDRGFFSHVRRRNFSGVEMRLENVNRLSSITVQRAVVEVE